MARSEQARYTARDPSYLAPEYDPETFGRLSERFARFLGTARFLVYMTVFVFTWVKLIF